MVKIAINPPPVDRKCEGCGIHLNELSDFEKAPKPGVKLVKTYRSMYYGPERPDLDEIIDKIDYTEEKDNFDELKKEYGEEKF